MVLSQSRLSANSAASFCILGLSSRPRLSALCGDRLVELLLLEPMTAQFWQRHFRFDVIETMYGHSRYDGHRGSRMVTSRSIHWAMVGRHQRFG